MNQTGDVGVLAYVDRPDPLPAHGMVLVQIAVAGVNFMDIGVRQGMAWNEMPNPKILGVEGAGRGRGGRRLRDRPTRRLGLRAGKLCTEDRYCGHLAGAHTRRHRRQDRRVGTSFSPAK
ncbi:D-arabinose 1-dehydrogenase-like Zn-dependent alcohol dehydrogenase [Variovorax paradoxus]|uniref:hypothetical protein n=1 Tax=Variovorax paradoxus TaxID=34073 RepID=UPI002780836F|nr:hypothetical protein [Variovorax paradoxus]MDQ0028091.1 D-arabinose 1-dehydrogenase-like Zn-dependent alcohol dehydrogenase [Variovorax paradoxus]